MEGINRISESLEKFYDKALLSCLIDGPLLPKPKYKNKKIQNYLIIRVPTIEKHECICDYYDDYFQNGWLITTKKIKINLPGKHLEKVAYYPKRKKINKTVTWKRYGK